jgi:hypothetical protein
MGIEISEMPEAVAATVTSGATNIQARAQIRRQ